MTTKMNKLRLSLSKDLSKVVRRGNWEDVYDYIIQLKEEGNLFVLFPELEDLDIVDSVNNATHKNVLDHTFEVLSNLRDILSKEYEERGQDYYDCNDNALVVGTLLHDIGKPSTKRFDKDKNTWTFYSHEEVGFHMLAEIFARFEADGYPFLEEDMEVIASVVRYHQLPSQLENVGDKGLRKFVNKCGPFVMKILTISKADMTSNNPLKILRGRKKVEVLTEKIQDFLSREELRLLKIDVSNQDIAELLGIEPKEAAKIKTRIKELVNEGRLVNDHNIIIEWIKGEYHES